VTTERILRIEMAGVKTAGDGEAARLRCPFYLFNTLFIMAGLLAGFPVSEVAVLVLRSAH
jgi:hypothetical protein